MTWKWIFICVTATYYIIINSTIGWFVFSQHYVFVFCVTILYCLWQIIWVNVVFWKIKEAKLSFNNLHFLFVLISKTTKNFHQCYLPLIAYICGRQRNKEPKKNSPWRVREREIDSSELNHPRQPRRGRRCSESGGVELVSQGGWSCGANVANAESRPFSRPSMSRPRAGRPIRTTGVRISRVCDWSRRQIQLSGTVGSTFSFNKFNPNSAFASLERLPRRRRRRIYNSFSKQQIASK